MTWASSLLEESRPLDQIADLGPFLGQQEPRSVALHPLIACSSPWLALPGVCGIVCAQDMLFVLNCDVCCSFPLAELQGGHASPRLPLRAKAHCCCCCSVRHCCCPACIGLVLLCGIGSVAVALTGRRVSGWCSGAARTRQAGHHPGEEGVQGEGRRVWGAGGGPGHQGAAALHREARNFCERLQPQYLPQAGQAQTTCPYPAVVG